MSSLLFGANCMEKTGKVEIVVVDDDLAVCNSLKFNFGIEGFTVRTFNNASDVLDQPDLPQAGCIVIDYNLPDMNGLILCGKLRRRAVEVPMILITSHPSAALRERAARVGIPIVEKPLLNNILLDEVRRALSPLHDGGQH